jgi:hypothetical protein
MGHCDLGENVVNLPVDIKEIYLHGQVIRLGIITFSYLLFIYIRIKKTRVRGRKCHDKTMLRNQTCASSL